MGRLVKEIRFEEGVDLTFLGQSVTIKVNRSRHSDNCVKLVIEADPDVLISTAGINRQDGKKEQSNGTDHSCN